MSLSRRSQSPLKKRKSPMGDSLNQLENKPTDTIKKSPINYERLKLITSHIQLHNINLKSASLHSTIDSRNANNLTGTKGYTLNLNEARWWLDGSDLEILLSYRASAFSMRDKIPSELFAVTASFIVTYSLDQKVIIPSADHDEMMADLVAANAQINAFPYLRQIVVDLTSRSGWPALLLKVFRAPASRSTALVKKMRAWEE